jgi:RNA 2',3'-cyclic 3'-phosphodiesterase
MSGGDRSRGGGGDRPKALRLFVGVRVSLATVRALDEAVQLMRRAERPGLRWLAPASYHVTLKFLGWTRPDVEFALRDRMAAALSGQRAFEVETVGLGAFPSLSRARVLWAGLDAHGGARLTDLAGRIEQAAAALGFAREERPFHGHVTLARLKTPGDVRSLLERCPEQAFRTSCIDSVVLFESHMKSTGSEYEEKARWPLEMDSKASRRHTGPVETETELPSEMDEPLDVAEGDLMPEAAPDGAAHREDPHAADDEERDDDGDQY